ncbi:hypothetical protein Vadar_033669 [Vaccinium darrowii]|uniref:Uncharacterized protein n=1 Tax=Vaccinium darrowii TaxID=229202 RepID=A0ACB7XLP7_9ERIC|nr:hypothetical protein Vadar_033669 [Vaccinium darrowii]
MQEVKTSLQQYNSKLQTDLATATESLKCVENEKATIVQNLTTLRNHYNALQDQLTSSNGFNDDDCFAEILKDDIVDLGKPILPSTPDILPVLADKAEHEKRLLQLTKATPLHILPVQGKANRRIRMGQQQPEKYHVEEFIHPRLKQAIATSLLRSLSIQNRMNRQTVCWA